MEGPPPAYEPPRPEGGSGSGSSSPPVIMQRIRALSAHATEIQAAAGRLADDMQTAAGGLADGLEGAVTAAAGGLRSTVGGILARVSAFVGIGRVPRVLLVSLPAPEGSALHPVINALAAAAAAVAPGAAALEVVVQSLGCHAGRQQPSWAADAKHEGTMGVVLVADARDRERFPDVRDETRELLAALGTTFADRGAVLVVACDAGGEDKSTLSAEEVVAQLGLRTMVPQVKWRLQQAKSATPDAACREGMLWLADEIGLPVDSPH